MAAFGTLNLTRKNSNSTINPPERRRATSATRGYCCGQYCHFKSDCPQPIRQGLWCFTPRANLECLLCNINYFQRNCPSLPAAQQATERSGQTRETEPQEQVAALSARPSAPNEPSAAFGRDGTAVLSECPSPDNQQLQLDLPPSSELTPQGESPVQVIDPAVPAMSLETSLGTPRKKLIFILGAVQTLFVWILADSGSVRNLIDEGIYNRLFLQAPNSRP